MPLWKLLSETDGDFPLCMDKADKTFDSVLNSNIIRSRETYVIKNRTVKGVIEDYPTRVALQKIAYLRPEEVDIDDLKEYICSFFVDEEKYAALNVNSRTDFNRLVRVYDFLAFSEKAKTRRRSNNARVNTECSPSL